MLYYFSEIILIGLVLVGAISTSVLFKKRKKEINCWLTNQLMAYLKKVWACVPALGQNINKQIKSYLDWCCSLSWSCSSSLPGRHSSWLFPSCLNRCKQSHNTDQSISKCTCTWGRMNMDGLIQKDILTSSPESYVFKREAMNRNKNQTIKCTIENRILGHSGVGNLNQTLICVLILTSSAVQEMAKKMYSICT